MQLTTTSRRAAAWRRLRNSLSLIWAIAVVDVASSAEMPTLVRDLNPYGAYPAEITVVGEKVFFASGDAEHGDELWCYDGTRSARVADLQVGPGDFQPAGLVVLGSRVYFHGGVAGRERELWTSDGTAAGTRLVTAWEGEATRIDSIRSNGRLLFLCVNSQVGGGTPFQLWVSDGTAAGTRQMPVQGVDSFNAFGPTFVGDKCYFTSDIGRKLWVTDGSAANTHELAASTSPGRGDLVRTTNGLVFFAWDELWVSDGTSTGTRPLEVNPGAAGSFPFNLIPLGEKVVFFANDGSHGFEPWITDGTAAGTRLLRDVAAGAASGISPNSYFVDGTITVRDTIPDMIGSAVSRAFFSNSSEAEGWELWSTDGSGAGTVRVVDLLPGTAGSAPLGFTALSNRIVFVATGPGSTGRELWISDGTAAGTRLLADLAAGAEESRPAGFVPYRNGLVFRAYDGEGTKLWFTDGTAAGSRVLDGRFSNSYGGSYSALTASGETLFFNFSDDDGETIHLGTSDGTAAGTRRVYGPIPTAVVSGSVSWTGYALFPLGRGEVLWTPWAEGLGTELWFSNGTFEGTGLLYDFSDETGWDASSPAGFVRLGDEIYFSAYVGLHRREYFRFNARDFTITPTVMGADGSTALGGYAYVAPQMAGGRLFINRISGRRPPMDWRVYMSRPGETPVELTGLGSEGMYPSATSFTAYRGLNYFTVHRDGALYELWRNDGTGSGNSRFAPNPNGEPFAVVSDRLLVLDGGALVSTDGTAAGTLRLVGARALVALAADATRAFLIERGSEGESALWVTDGSIAGTQRVRGFERTAFYETTRGVLVNGVLFFRARTETAGAELWRSDGTAEGTRMVADLWPGSGDGATEQIAATSDGRVFYVGRTPLYGYELFEVPPSALAAVNPLAVVIPVRSQAVAPGGGLTLTAEIAAGYDSALQWERNGVPVSGATGASLSLSGLQPASAGLYTLRSTLSAGSTTSNPTIVGVNTTAKVIGAGEEVLPANVKHPNGNIYDQILLSGVAATITADSASDQVSRLSFIDDNDDIVQVEFAGPGTLTLMLDAERSPATPRNYSQAVSYVKGRGGIVITGADERTHVSVFCVGRATAFDSSGAFDITRAIGPDNDPARNGSPLFVGHDSTRYDGIADLAFIAIASRNGRFGGVRAANTRFSASEGVVGLYAPNVVFDGPVFVANVNASGSARPMLVGGSIGEMRVCGGDLFQDNGRPVQVSGIIRINFTAGSDSHGKAVSARGNRGRLEDEGQDVTAQVVMNP